MGILDDLGSIFGGSGDAASVAAPPIAAPQQNVGFTGGLMGQQPQQQPFGALVAGNALGALGRSLLTSPSNNPLQNFSASMQAQTKAAGGDGQKQAIIAALRAKGLNDAQIAQALQQAGMSSPLDLMGQSPGLTSFAAPSPAPAQPATGMTADLGFGTSDQIATNRSFV